VRVLGLSCGPADGSSELLLKAALQAAEAHGAEVAHVRLADLRLSTAPISLGPDGPDDDAPWFFDQLMDSDGLIVAAPVLNRTVPGALKVLLDRLLGPKADVAFALEYRRMREAGEAATVRFGFDERVLRPRVGGFLAVGGALTDRWKTLALPLMHHLTFSMQIGIVDQALFGGAGVPGAIVLDDAALARAARLGREVTAQAGRPFDDVEFRGEPGVCPMCHLDAVTLRGTEVECATCGAAGELVVAGDRVEVRFTPEGCAKSVLSIAEKHDHFLEVQETAERQLPQAEVIAERAAPLRAYDRRLAPALAGP
jgi:multimeric flavodoxin WrbA